MTHYTMTPNHLEHLRFLAKTSLVEAEITTADVMALLDHLDSTTDKANLDRKRAALTSIAPIELKPTFDLDEAASMRAYGLRDGLRHYLLGVGKDQDQAIAALFEYARSFPVLGLDIGFDHRIEFDWIEDAQVWQAKRVKAIGAS